MKNLKLDDAREGLREAVIHVLEAISFAKADGVPVAEIDEICGEQIERHSGIVNRMIYRAAVDGAREATPCVKCGYGGLVIEWLDGGNTCPQCRTVQPGATFDFVKFADLEGRN